MEPLKISCDCYKQGVPPELYLISLLTPEEFPVYSITLKRKRLRRCLLLPFDVKIDFPAVTSCFNYVSHQAFLKIFCVTDQLHIY
jgi:hypothetical protein